MVAAERSHRWVLARARHQVGVLPNIRTTEGKHVRPEESAIDLSVDCPVGVIVFKTCDCAGTRMHVHPVGPDLVLRLSGELLPCYSPVGCESADIVGETVTVRRLSATDVS